MKEHTPISFGDNVRAKDTPATREIGVAGLNGDVRGETILPCDFDVIGDVQQNYALNVYFEERGEAFWFTPDQLELVDHAVGTSIRLAGVDKEWVRNESGGWDEITIKKRESLWEFVTGFLFGRRRQ